jgi:hypothetical protein
MALVAVGYTELAMVAQFCAVLAYVLHTEKNMLIKRSKILPPFRLYLLNMCIVFHIQAETGVI